MELVEVPVGNDDFTAQYLSDLFTDEGVHNQLILNHDPRASLSRAYRHRVIVAVDDLPAVEAMLADHAPGLVGAEVVEHHVPTRTVRQRSLRLLFGVPLLAVALAIVLSLLIVFFRLLV